MYNYNLNKVQIFIALTIIICFSVILFLTAKYPSLDDIMLKIILEFTGFILVVCIFSLFYKILSKNFPLKIKNIKKEFGEPLYLFRLLNIAEIGGVPVRGFYCNCSIYPEFIVVRFCGRALVVKKSSQIKFDNVKLFGSYIHFKTPESECKIRISQKQLEIITQFLSRGVDRND